FSTRRGVLMEHLKVILVISFILVLFTITAAEDWFIQLAIQTADYTGPGHGFRDGSNKAGVKDDASRGYDSHDAYKFTPPDPDYIILYFPHYDPGEPDYWAPPYDNIYAFDYRAPGFEEEIWHIDVYSARSVNTECLISRKKLEAVPAQYGIFLVNNATSDTFNIRFQDTVSATIPPVISDFELIVKDDIHSHIKIFPGYTSAVVGERLYMYTYIYTHDGDSFQVASNWEATGPSGIIEDPGQFFATSAGTNTIIADYCGFKDSVDIAITGEGSQVSINCWKGWNMFSMPVIPPNWNIEQCLPYFDGALYYYDPDSGDYFLTEVLDTFTGYFGYSQKDTSILVVGLPFDHHEEYLSAGWHLIGSISEAINISSGCRSVPENALIRSFYKFNTLTNRYSRLSYLYPGNAFWVFMKADGTIILED
ncbi:hypothetical protein JXI42_06640, partial [bacterium]|nr:hypothetical protein [bacterium]